MLDRKTGAREHRIFRDIVEYLNPGDCLVINNTKVTPARLYGAKEGTQAKIEILLLKRREGDVWGDAGENRAKRQSRARRFPSATVFTGEVLDVVDEGNRLIKFTYDGIFEEILDQLGQMPLPPLHYPSAQGQEPVSDRLCEA